LEERMLANSEKNDKKEELKGIEGGVEVIDG